MTFKIFIIPCLMFSLFSSLDDFTYLFIYFWDRVHYVAQDGHINHTYPSSDLSVLVSMTWGLTRNNQNSGIKFNNKWYNSISDIFSAKIKEWSHAMKIEAQSANTYWILTTHEVNCCLVSDKEMEANEWITYLPSPLKKRSIK